MDATGHVCGVPAVLSDAAPRYERTRPPWAMERDPVTEPEMNAVYPGRGFAGTPRVPTDSERLDWLEKYYPDRNPDYGTYPPRIMLDFEADDRPHRSHGPTLRDAIDAGMRITGDA